MKSKIRTVTRTKSHIKPATEFVAGIERALRRVAKVARKTRAHAWYTYLYLARWQSRRPKTLILDRVPADF